MSIFLKLGNRNHVHVSAIISRYYRMLRYFTVDNSKRRKITDATECDKASPQLETNIKVKNPGRWKLSRTHSIMSSDSATIATSATTNNEDAQKDTLATTSNEDVPNVTPASTESEDAAKATTASASNEDALKAKSASTSNENDSKATSASTKKDVHKTTPATTKNDNNEWSVAGKKKNKRKRGSNNSQEQNSKDDASTTKSTEVKGSKTDEAVAGASASTGSQHEEKKADLEKLPSSDTPMTTDSAEQATPAATPSKESVAKGGKDSKQENKNSQKKKGANGPKTDGHGAGASSTGPKHEEKKDDLALPPPAESCMPIDYKLQRQQAKQAKREQAEPPQAEESDMPIDHKLQRQQAKRQQAEAAATPSEESGATADSPNKKSRKRKNKGKGRKDDGSQTKTHEGKGPRNDLNVASASRLRYDEKKGDLFYCDPDVSLAHCVSMDLHMGKGIAVQFKKQFGRVGQLRGQDKRVGQVAVLRTNTRFVYYLVTKTEYFKKPSYHTLKSSLEDMKRHCEEHRVRDLAMPMIGCGLDGLDWGQVSAMIRDIFRDLDMNITVYYM